MTVHVRQASGTPTFEGDADSADITAGQLVYWKDADDEYALADASDHTKPAQFIVVQSGSSGQVDRNDRVIVSKIAELYDDAAGFTENAPQYLSETAGAYTETRPTTVAALKQKVGEAISTSRALFQINMTQEVTVPIVLQYATSAAAVLDSGNHGAAGSLDAQNEVAYLTAIIPQNFLAVVDAGLYIATEATAGTPTLTITVGSALDGEQHDAVTADATLATQTFEGAAADEIHVIDLTTGLDATDIVRPNAILGFKGLKADAGTDIGLIFGGYIVCEVAA